MTEQEYREKLKELKSEYETKKSLLAREFAYSNNPYKIGDIITDDFSIIKIESFCYCDYVSGYLPNVGYNGIELTKKLIPKKNGEVRRIWKSTSVRKLK